ncbi:MAG TPA: DUF523 domain-containing protein [Oscillospiraceae bacterium]|nr:DUF523 domain-containing protein [Oscillospiraceae bacterium]HNW04939.1 DUF523 domain-containing protein [Oscillospiraceae bacterium]HPV99652.1 DUF523 domain-containing protein [Oscillospiraceae bacterium]
MGIVLVSRCLLGCPCRYDGKSCPDGRVLALGKEHALIGVCPECDGGLPTPRPPAERRGESVVTASGADVTEAYRRGAEIALRLAKELHADYAVLKAKSPSCGRGMIYDGGFTGTLVPGNGVTAELLLQNGVPVKTENDL